MPGLYPRRWWALFLLCAAQFIVILDTSIIGIALPAIQRALGFSPENLQWVFNAYVVIFGGLMLLGGRLADLLGRRAVFITGFLILVGGSLLAGLAWSDAVLIAARAVQGLGAALIGPSALSIVMQVFTDPKELSRAFGFWGGAAAAGGTAGVFLGGVITEWLSWRWTFLINVPLGLLVMLLAPALLPRGQRSRGSVDYAGALAITTSLVLAVYAIVTGDGAGWLSLPTLSALAAAAALFVAFIIVESGKREPLVPLRIFSAPNLGAANLLMALLGGAWIPLWFFLNLYLQEVLHTSAFQSGLALVPMTTVIMILMMAVTPKLVARFGFKANLVAGLVVLGLATALFGTIPADGSFLVHVLPLSLVGAVGMSLAYIPVTIAGMSGARPEESGLASGLISTSYQVGSALGLAVMVALASSKTATLAAAGVSSVEALNGGYQAAFLGAAVVAGVAALISAVAVRGAAPAGGDAAAVQPVA